MMEQDRVDTCHAGWWVRSWPLLASALTACATPTLDAPPGACGVIASLGGDACEFPDHQDFDARGVWEYGASCSYTAASDNFASQIGLSCSGRLALCAPTLGRDVTWQDVGPNGVGIGAAQSVLLSSGADKSGSDYFAAFGDLRVSTPGGGCTADVEGELVCVTRGPNDAQCYKVSYKVDGACGAGPGWVVSAFTFRRVGGC